MFIPLRERQTDFDVLELGLLQVIDPLRSRCLCVRVPGPTGAEIQQVLQHVADKENLQLPDALRQRVVQVDSHPVLCKIQNKLALESTSLCVLPLARPRALR